VLVADRVELCPCDLSTPVDATVPLLAECVRPSSSSTPARGGGSALCRPDLIPPPWLRDSDLVGGLATFDPLPGGTRPEADPFADSARVLADGRELQLRSSALEVPSALDADPTDAGPRPHAVV